MPGPRYNAAQQYIVTALSLVITALLLGVSNGPVYWVAPAAGRHPPGGR